MNFYNCLRLVDECVKAGLIRRDSHNKNNVLVYRNAGTTAPEGWYSENAHTVAQELMEDSEGQLTLKKALANKGIEFKIASI